MSTTTKSPVIDHRYEFVYLFDVQDGNPNGDPDAGNTPRIDPETGQGLVTDVCLKRKLRNFVQITQSEGADEELKPKPGYEIYVKDRGILAHQQRRAYKRAGQVLEPDSKPLTIKLARAWMCENFFDVRAFGAVMSTGKAGDEDSEDKPKKAKDQDDKKKAAGTQKLWNCGQVRGPIQLSFARSIDPILTLEHAITRVALTNPGDTKRGADLGDDTTEATSGQIGRKFTVPYALYRAHGFVSPFLARDTGFSTADLDVFWKGLINMFEFDRSASRGVMAARALIVFEHESALGNHPSHLLLDGVKCKRKPRDDKAPPRKFDDYDITIDSAPIAGVHVNRMIRISPDISYEILRN